MAWHQSLTSRFNKLTAAASSCCSRADSRAAMVRDSQSCRAARPVRSRSRQASVRDIIVCRPSSGSGAPRTRPADSSAAIAALIDCGRIPSDRARLDTVAGPSFSRRSRTATWEGGRSSRWPCSRSRRFSVPISKRRSSASAEVRADPVAPAELLMRVGLAHMKINCKDYLLSFPVELSAGGRVPGAGRGPRRPAAWIMRPSARGCRGPHPALRFGAGAGLLVRLQ